MRKSVMKENVRSNLTKRFNRIFDALLTKISNLYRKTCTTYPPTNRYIYNKVAMMRHNKKRSYCFFHIVSCYFMYRIISPILIQYQEYELRFLEIYKMFESFFKIPRILERIYLKCLCLKYSTRSM